MVTTKRAASPAAPASKLPAAIQPLRSGMDRFTRILVYGDPGVGKTPFAASAPNALILEADRGLESAIATGSTAKKWKLDDWNDATEALEYMRSGGGCKEFEWLVLDSLTMFQERGMDMIMADLVAAKPHRQVYAPDKGEYGQNMNRTSKFVRDLKDLPINLCITAHASVIEREMADGSIITQMMPAVQGKGMSQKMCGYVGMVGHIQTKPSKKGDGEFPVLSTRRRDGWYGKDRYGAVTTMANPTIPKVIAAIEAKLDPSNKQTGE